MKETRQPMYEEVRLDQIQGVDTLWLVTWGGQRIGAIVDQKPGDPGVSPNRYVARRGDLLGATVIGTFRHRSNAANALVDKVVDELNESLNTMLFDISENPGNAAKYGREVREMRDKDGNVIGMEIVPIGS